MSFQKQINASLPRGVAGDKASLNPVAYTAGNPLAEGPVNAGGFVWTVSAPDQAKSSGSGQPLGFVERWLRYVNADIDSPAAMTVPDGQPLHVARRGDLYAVSQTAASVGQKVFAVLADGTIKTGAAGASVSGAVETAWTVAAVEQSGAAGDIITISA